MNTITINSDELSNAIQKIVGVVEKKQTMPILSHILIECKGDVLTLTSTDLEVQLSTQIKTNTKSSDFITTAPGRKLHEIIRSLDNTELVVSISDADLTIESSRSKFKLQSLAPNEFPLFEATVDEVSFVVKQSILKTLFQRTHFAMAQQDIRYYLNGLLIETSPNLLTSVGTDGHRLAKSVAKIDKSKLYESSFIVPRKAIQEAQRIIEEAGDTKITLTDNQATFDFNKVKLITKLIDGSFPDYVSVIPPETSINILIKTENIKPALQRVSILANEKFKGVRIDIEDKQLTVSSENPQEEKAKETIDIDSTGQNLSVGFNVSYLIDAISACEGDLINIGLNDENSSALITDPTDPESKFVVMPMRL
tara:strand:- start:2511 stop:3611 length:1101 start_codon:yes stop_codon:yes gene_type:complete